MHQQDVDRLRRWFVVYCRSYLTDREEDNRNIRLKEEHTLQVCAFMNLLTESLHLGREDRLLAECVAFCHDVGRFEQYRRFGTFKDSDSVNHAAFGCGILAGDQVLDFLPEADRRIILRSVALPNVFRLPATIDERLALFARLVRDADKLDIWRIFIEYYDQPEALRPSAAGLGFTDHAACTPAVLAELRSGRMIELSLLKTLDDFKLLKLSWVYDLNFTASFRLILERGFISRLASTLPHTAEVMEAVGMVETYVESRAAGEDQSGARVTGRE